MKRFLNKLFRDMMTPSKARASRPATRRAVLQVDGLEDRMVLSSASLIGSTLNIDVSPGGATPVQARNILLYELNPTGNRQIEVIDGFTKIGQFSINSIKAVDVSVSGNDNVIINDSDGMPFATGTPISFQGLGTNDTLTLDGTRAIDTGEDYIVGGTSTTPTSILLDGLDFQLSNAIQQVDDYLQITGGSDYVATSGQNVVLSSPSSGTQMLSGMGPGGGSTLIFANKPTVELNEFAADATVNLDAAGAAALETGMSVVTHGQGDIVVVATTSVPTTVQTIGTDSEVVLQANRNPVSVIGNSGSSLIIGAPESNGDSTHFIQSNVAVQGMGVLLIADNANVSTQENVTVTQSNISSNGLFGNNAVDVSYSGVGSVDIFSGQLQDEYTVVSSSPIAEFTSKINLFDDSSVFFGAHVDVDANSHLNLSLINETSKPGELFISAPGGKFSNQPEGVIDVSFNGVLNSQIDDQGFTIEEEHS